MSTVEVKNIKNEKVGEIELSDQIFNRELLGAPLRWTGLLPPHAVVELVDRALAGSGHTLHSISEGRTTPL